MQRLASCCPRCDQPLGISWDMWGKYYLCGACGFTAEDDDDLHGKVKEPLPPPTANLTQIETYRVWHSAPRR